MSGRPSSLTELRKHPSRILVVGFLVFAAGCAPEPEVGVVVESVDAWGRASAAGIEASDRILAWRWHDAGGPARNPLELLWIEYDLAPRHGVTLEVDRKGKTFEVRLEDSGWYWALRPALDRDVRAAYRELATVEEADVRLEAWKELESLFPEDSPERVWAARRTAAAAFDAGRIDEARRSFHKARASIGRGELRAALDFEEGEGLAKIHRFAAAIEPFAGAASTLADIDPGCPLRAFVLSRHAAMLASQQRRDEARRVSRTALEIVQRHPRAHHVRGQVVNNAGIVFHYEGDLEKAASYYHQVVEELPGVDGARRATTGYNLGLIREVQGYYERANELLSHALAEAERLDLPRTQIGSILNALGILNKNMGAFELASEYFHRALAYFPRGGVTEADTRLNLGNLAVDLGGLTQAEENLRAALEAYQKLTPDSLGVAMAYHNLGRTLDRMKRLAEAEEALRRALSLEEELVPESIVMATTIAVLGAVRYRQGNPEAARTLLRRAKALEERAAPNTAASAETLLSLGDAELAVGHREAAIDLWRQGLQNVGRLREQVPGTHGKARFSTQYHDYHVKLAELLLEDGHAEEAFLTLERSSARMLRTMLQQQESRVAMKLAPEMESRRRQLDARIRGIFAQLGQLHAADDEDPRQHLREQLRALKVERGEITERLHRSAPRIERLDRLPEVSIQRIRRSLPADSLGLSLMLGEGRSFLFVVAPYADADRDGRAIEVFDLPLTRREVESRVSIFRGLIERGRESPRLEKALVRQGATLFDQLLRPALERIENASRLFIAPDVELATVPFAALVRSEDPLSFLAEWKPHVIVPSMSSLAELSAETSRPEADYEMVAIGDARFDKGGRHGAFELEALPGSRQEVGQISQLFAPETKILLAEEATESAVRAFMPRSRYVHFATHAFLDRQFPLDSSLALTLESELSAEGEDGLLHGWEIVEGPALAADLVSLAGCETGLGVPWAGEGLVGLVQAFHYVGVPTILGSQWRVADTWVGELTQPFYENLRSGQEPMNALASAQRMMIRSQIGAMRHPYYWASFTLYGAGHTVASNTSTTHSIAGRP